METRQEKSSSRQPWIREDLVVVPLQAQNATDAITQLGTRLQAGGFVRESWIPAALEREKTFATGLPTAGVGVAIPHADVEHVRQQAIAVGVLEEPVSFGEMGDPDSTVSVRIVCALAVAQSELLVTLLQRLVGMFQAPGVLGQIVEARSPADVVAIFDQHIQLE
jgi:PTS system galactitol-specific IIA component